VTNITTEVIKVIEVIIVIVVTVVTVVIVVTIIVNYMQNPYSIILMAMVIIRLIPIIKVDFLNGLSVVNVVVHNNSFNFTSYQVNFSFLNINYGYEVHDVHKLDFNYSYLHFTFT
jgi:hypothetical protein